MKSFDRLPAAFQCDAVRPYYDKLCKKTASLVVKRIFDIVVALVMLAFLILPILVIAVLVKATSPGHVFFRQERVTTYGRRFRIFKFRTMVENAEALGTQVTTDGDSRVTKIGRVLRKYRLDELPPQTMTWEAAWFGAAIGFPCVGVLNLNNIRDMDNDRLHGKHTFASLLGPIGGRVYHTCLLTGCLTIFALYGHWWTLCVLPIWAWHLWYVWTHSEKLDLQMPVLMFSTLIVSILALI